MTSFPRGTLFEKIYYSKVKKKTTKKNKTNFIKSSKFTRNFCIAKISHSLIRKYIPVSIL